MHERENRPTRATGTALALVRAAHPGPALAVAVVAGLLAVASGQPTTTVALVFLAVLAGQLTVGWGNDLVDRERDRVSGRLDKPLATGELRVDVTLAALLAAAVACLVLTALLGWRAAIAHLVCLAWAHAYNLGLKSTAWSWVPYAAAFGLLPAVASLAGGDPERPAWWAVAAGATLGVGAHLVNALPDLTDDERTGVRGLPHRMGPRRSRVAAAALLVAASVLAALGPDGAVGPVAFGLLGGVLVLAAVSLLGDGRWPFRAAMGIALLDVVLLVAAT
ncbi:UbiA family prenyltransferase [Nocardioides sp. W7]|uniref:UbiA family prenyltransferase n=1 Tax=Nocardioides sp. W7 TaxID=2931390 RepID=UPI001FD0422D|nr:UbiA family prenyltransferase [Nocardioides sp. W7]